MKIIIKREDYLLEEILFLLNFLLNQTHSYLMLTLIYFNNIVIIYINKAKIANLIINTTIRNINKFKNSFSKERYLIRLNMILNDKILIYIFLLIHS